MRIKSETTAVSGIVETGGQSELGRIGIGKVNRDSAKPYPVATDYFIPRGNFVEPFIAMFGDKPAQLPIWFSSDNENFVCNERLEIRDKGGNLYGFGDGEEFTFFHPTTKKYSIQRTTRDRPTLMEDTVAFLKKEATAEQAKQIKWSTVLYLRFSLQGFPLLGYWQFSTKGAGSSIPAIREAFDSCKQTFGTIRYIPFMLTVKKVKSNKPGVNSQFAVVSLVPMISLEEGFKLAQALQLNPTAHPYALLYLQGPEDRQRPILALNTGE